MDFSKEKIIKETKSFIIIFIAVFSFRTTLFEPNHIPSGSLLPTNAIGDFVLVNKFAYGFKLPFSEWTNNPVYLTKFESPKRGDIVVFDYPQDRSLLYVKRMIGLPGDKIAVIDNNVFLNGQPMKRLKIEDKKKLMELFDDERFPNSELEFYETEIDGKKFNIAENFKRPYHLNTRGELTVPEGHFFVMGDNRDYSADSRDWGFVPQSHIRGKAILVWFSMVYPWSQEKWHFRPSRIGTLL